MKPSAEDSTVALTVQQKLKRASKGDRSSKSPNNLCHLPSHALSILSNAECRTQSPSLQPTRPTTQPRPMGRSNHHSNTPTSRGLAAISMLTDAEKARLFDYLQSSHANTVTPNQSAAPDATSSTSTSNANNNVVYFANAYLAIAQSQVKSNDMISDSGADRFIFHSPVWNS